MRKRVATTWVLLAAAALVLMGGGCYVPVPHTRVHAYGVTGRLVSASDGCPITNAVIVSAAPMPGTTRSDGTGCFCLPPQRGWHFAYFVGTLTMSALPYWDIPVPERDLRIAAAGYATTDFAVKAWSDPLDRKEPVERVGAFLRAGELRLVPQEVRGDGKSAAAEAPIPQAVPPGAGAR